MSQCTEFYMDSSDKKSKLHVMEWLPDTAPVKAVLQLAHGIGEHIRRYDTFARFMTEHGFAVIANSHLGHGESAACEADMGFFAEKDGWNTAVRDMRLLYDIEHAKYPALPYFLLGHSMGSFMARTFLIQYPSLLTGCILSGTGQQPALLLSAGLAVATIQKIFSGVRKKSPSLNNLSFGTYNNRIANPRTASDWLTRDDSIVDLYVADDTCGFVPSIGIFIDMLGGIKFIGKKTNVDKMRKNLPVFFISGEEDPVGEYSKGPKIVYALFKSAGMTDLSLKLYPGARHEVLNETNKQEVFQDVLDWINSKI